MTSLRSSVARRFRVVAFTAMLVLSFAIVAVNAQEDGVTRRLHWVNGDELTGQIAGATTSHLIWRCDALAQDIAIDYRTLKGVEFIDEKANNDLNAVFMVAMINGDMISGDLLKLDAERLVLSRPRHGEITIDRKWVDRLIRTDHSAPIDLTATRGRGWTTVDPSWQEQNPERYRWDFEEPGDEDVYRKVSGDLGSLADETTIRTKMVELMAEAKRQLMDEA